MIVPIIGILIVLAIAVALLVSRGKQKVDELREDH